MINVLNATQDANIIKYGALISSLIVHGTHLFWAGVETVRESSSDKKLIYYCCTLLPLFLGILAPIFLGIFLVVIPPTVSIAWTGVGVIISDLARDFFQETN